MVEREFLYKHNYWGNRMAMAKTDDDMLKVAGEFAGAATDSFCRYAQAEDGPNLRKLLKIIDGHAQRMVVASDGVSPGYRLTKDWVRTIFAQLTMHGAVDTAIDDGEDVGVTKSDAEDKIRALWSSLGWDPDISLNPTYSQVNTVFPVKFNKNGGKESGCFNLVLEPTDEFPIGAQYETGKGTIFEVNDFVNGSIVCQDQEPPYRLVPFGAEQLRGWKRIV